MPQQILDFARQDQPLYHAVLNHPPTRAKAYALFIHCLHSLGSHTEEQIIAPLVRSNIGVLSLDLGGQSGQQQKESQPLSLADIEQAIDWLSKNHFMPQIYAGHSLGSLPILFLGKKNADIRAAISLSTPTTSELTTLTDNQDLFNPTTTDIRLGKTTIRLDKSLVEAVQQQRMEQLLEQKAPVLLLHAADDKIHSFEQIRTLTAQTQHSLISLPDGDHQLSKTDAASSCGKMATAWINCQLSEHKNKAASILGKDEQEVHNQNVSVRETIEQPCQQTARLGDHHFFIDLPTEDQGTNSGPSPMQLMLAALAAATSNTIRKHAYAKDWQLDSIHIESRMVQNTHSADAAIPSSEYIILEINLTGSLDRIQKNTLIDIATNSDIHQHLSTKVIIRLINNQA